MASKTPEFETFQLGDWELQCGKSIPNAHIAYKTFGNRESPAIVYPTWFSGGELSHGKFSSHEMLKATSHIRQLLAHRGGQNLEPKKGRGNKYITVVVLKIAIDSLSTSS